MSDEAQDSPSVDSIREAGLNCLLVLPPGTSGEEARPLVQTLKTSLNLNVSVLSLSEDGSWEEWIDKWDEYSQNSIVILDITEMNPIITYIIGLIHGGNYRNYHNNVAIPISRRSGSQDLPPWKNVTCIEEYDISDEEELELVETIRRALEGTPTMLLAKIFGGAEGETEHGDSKNVTEEPREGVPASIYLPGEVSVLDRDRLTTAVGEFMESMGFEPEQEEEPMLGSWYQKLWFKAKNFFSQDQVQEAYEDGYDALKAHIEGSTAAEQTSELGGAAAELIESLENTPDATIRLGNLILLKKTVDGEPRIHIETVSPSLMRELESRDLFQREPEEVKDFIEERRAEAVAPDPTREPEQLPEQGPTAPKPSEESSSEAAGS